MSKIFSAFKRLRLERFVFVCLLGVLLFFSTACSNTPTTGNSASLDTQVKTKALIDKHEMLVKQHGNVNPVETVSRDASKGAQRAAEDAKDAAQQTGNTLLKKTQRAVEDTTDAVQDSVK